MKKKKIKFSANAVFIVLLLLAMCLVNAIVIEIINEHDQKLLLKIIQMELVFLYITNFYFSIIKKGLYSLYSFFLFTLGFFSLFGVVLSMIGVNDFTKSQINIISFDWKTKTACVILNYYIAFLSIFCGFLFTKDDEKKNIKRDVPIIYEHNTVLLDISKKVMLISLPFAFAYRLQYALTVLSVGRKAVYIGEINLGGTFNTVLLIIDYLFSIAYYLICANEVNYKKFDLYSIIYIGMVMISFLYGSRGGAICTIMFVILFRYRLFGKKLPIKKIGFLFIALIIVMVYIGIVRQGGNFTISNLLEEIKDFFVVQAGSLNIAGYYYQNRTVLANNTYPYIFDPIFRIFLVMRYPQVFDHGQSMDMLRIRMDLNHHVTNSISSAYYLSGAGCGSNFIAEMSEFGLWGVIFFSMIFMIIFSIFNKKMTKSNFVRFIAPLFVTFVLFAPRGDVFFDTYTIIKYGLIYLVVMTITKVVTKRKYDKIYNDKIVEYH